MQWSAAQNPAATCGCEKQHLKVTQGLLGGTSDGRLARNSSRGSGSMLISVIHHLKSMVSIITTQSN